MFQGEFDMVGKRLRPHPTCRTESEFVIGLADPSDEDIHVTSLAAIGPDGVLLRSVSQNHRIHMEILRTTSPTHTRYQGRLDWGDVLFTQLDIGASLPVPRPGVA